MTVTVYSANSRGTADYGWLKTKYSFSFANYHDRNRMGFGALRVLNDDILDANHGFDTHPHANMEIITIVTKGVLSHADSMGHEQTLEPSEVQVMSAGSGLLHSEYNNSTHAVHLFQIWIHPKEKNISPKYGQKKFTLDVASNTLTVVASGDMKDTGLYIHQDAKVLYGVLKEGSKYIQKIPSGSGAFLFCVNGTLLFDMHTLKTRDAAEIRDADSITLTAKEKSTVLLILVPLYSSY